MLVYQRLLVAAGEASAFWFIDDTSWMADLTESGIAKILKELQRRHNMILCLCWLPRSVTSSNLSKSVEKGGSLDGSYRLRDDQTCQGAAVAKGTRPDGSYRLRDSQTRQRAAASKSTSPNGCQRLWKGQSCQGAAVLKGRVTDLSHGVRNRKPQQRPAFPEGLRPEGFSVRDASSNSSIARPDSDLVVGWVERLQLLWWAPSRNIHRHSTRLCWTCPVKWRASN